MTRDCFLLVHPFFSFVGKEKVAIIAVFLSKLDHRTLLYILRDYSSAGIGFNMISKCHTLLVVYTMLV